MNNTQPRKTSALRRTIAGIAAASAIAFGGVGTLSAADAQAAGVKAATYVVAPSSVQVQTGTTVPNRGKN